jgi:clan AA aspartic protease
LSAFLNLTPTVRVVIGNPFSGTRYPSEKSVVAVIDSGYEGFLAVPTDVFKHLRLDELQQQRRTLVLANGDIVTSNGAYATLEMPHLPVKLNGFLETYRGLEEIILGVQALSRFKSTLDYCSKKVTLQPCP